MLYVELGVYKIDITVKCRMISFWLKLATDVVVVVCYGMHLLKKFSMIVDFLIFGITLVM